MPPEDGNEQNHNQETGTRNEPHSRTPRYEDDPLLRLLGSGKRIWADEHADEYVNNLRREDIS